jgi:elongator complex protein 4
LLRYYAAEGVVQGHVVHVVGVGEQWGRELPGLVGTAGDKVDKEAEVAVDKERMKIAWRYEKLGEFGSGSRGGNAPMPSIYFRVHKKNDMQSSFWYVSPRLVLTPTAPPSPSHNPKAPAPGQPEERIPTSFCHTFDLTKRLTLPTPSTINSIPIPPNSAPSASPYTPILTSLTNALHTTNPHTIHRLIIATILSPALYPPHACDPIHLLPFLHSLRALLRAHPARLTAMLTLPLSLHPRTTGLVCWIEHLCDGVLELAPFPHSIDVEPPRSGKTEEKPQGMVKVHRLPVLSEKGGGGGGGDDLAFSLSRKRFVIKPYSLPPVEGDHEAQRGESEGGKMKVDLEF